MAHYLVIRELKDGGEVYTSSTKGELWTAKLSHAVIYSDKREAERVSSYLAPKYTESVKAMVLQ
jgi:hypothetical protein